MKTPKTRKSIKAEAPPEEGAMPPGAGYERDPSVSAPEPNPQAQAKPAEAPVPEVKAPAKPRTPHEDVLSNPLPYVIDSNAAIEKVEVLLERIGEARPDLRTSVEQLLTEVDALEQKSLGDAFASHEAAEAGGGQVFEQPAPEQADYKAGTQVTVKTKEGDVQGVILEKKENGLFRVNTPQNMVLDNVPVDSLVLTPSKDHSMLLPAAKILASRKAWSRKIRVRAAEEGQKTITEVEEVVSPESAEQADFDEEKSGEVGEVHYEAGEESPVDWAIAYLKENGATEHSSSDFDPRGWYSTPDAHKDPQSGDETTYSYHLKGFSPEEIEQIHAKMTGKSAKVKAGAEPTPGGEPEAEKGSNVLTFPAEDGVTASKEQIKAKAEELRKGIKAEAAFVANDIPIQKGDRVSVLDGNTALVKTDPDQNGEVEIQMLNDGSEKRVHVKNLKPMVPGEPATRKPSYRDTGIDMGASLDASKGHGEGGVVERDGKFVVLSKDGKVLGTHATREEADKQVAAVKFSQGTIHAEVEPVIQPETTITAAGTGVVAYTPPDEGEGEIQQRRTSGGDKFHFVYNYKDKTKHPHPIIGPLNDSREGAQVTLDHFKRSGRYTVNEPGVGSGVESRTVHESPGEERIVPGAPKPRVEASAFDKLETDLDLGSGYKARKKKGKEGEDGKKEAGVIEALDPDGKVIETLPDAFGDDAPAIIKLLRQVLKIKDEKDTDNKAKKPEGEKPPKEDGAPAGEKPLGLPAVEPKKDKEKDEAVLAASQQSFEAHLQMARETAVAYLRTGKIRAEYDTIHGLQLEGLSLTAAQEAAANQAIDAKVLEFVAMPSEKLRVLHASRHTPQALLPVTASLNKNGVLTPGIFASLASVSAEAGKGAPRLGAAFGVGARRR